MKHLTLLLLLLSWLPALAEPWTFRAPPSAVHQVPVNTDWRGAATFDVEVALNDLQGAEKVLVSVFIETKQNEWYENKTLVSLGPGAAHRFTLGLNDLSPDWEAHGTSRPWGSDVLRWVRNWGVKVFSPTDVTGTLAIGTLRIIPAETPLPVTISRIMVPPTTTTQRPLPISFELLNFAENPYDLTIVDLAIEAAWTGGSATIPVSYRQDYVRLTPPHQTISELRALERPIWQGTWLPVTGGSVSFRLVGTIHGQAIDHPLGNSQISNVGATVWTRGATDINPPFTQEVATIDAPRLAFTAGGWRLTNRHDGHWWAPLDWHAAWGTYTGAGEYDQHIAWEFEQFFLANPDTPPAPLLLFDTRELEDSGQYNWHANPLNRANGGPLALPSAYFDTPETRELILRKARYLWARYGHYPLTSGLLLRLDRADDQAVLWLDGITAELHRLMPDVAIYVDCPAMLLRAPIVGIEQTRPFLHEDRVDLAGKWQLDTRLSTTTNLQALTTDQLTLYGESPLAIAAPLNANWAAAQYLLIETTVDDATRRDIRLSCQLRTWRSTVWESDLVALPTDGKNRLLFGLEDPSAWHNPADPEAKLSAYDLVNVRELAVRAFSSLDSPVQIGLATTVRLWVPSSEPPPLQILAADVSTPTPTAGHPLHLEIDLNQPIANPFDPSRIRLDCLITRPDGETEIRPAFLHIPLRRDQEGEAERVGQIRWRVSYTPEVPGTYSYRLQARARKQKPVRLAGKFQVAKATVAAPKAKLMALVQPSRRIFQYTGTNWHPPVTVPPGMWLVPTHTSTPDGTFQGPGEVGLSEALTFDLDSGFGDQLNTLWQQKKQAPLVIISDDELRLGSSYTWPHRQEGFYRDPRQVTFVAARARYLWARYGGHPAISGILIDIPRAGPEETSFITDLVKQLGRYLPQVTITSTSPELPAREWVRELPLTTLWKPDPRLAAGTTVRQIDGRATLAGPTPGQIAVVAQVNEHLVTDSVIAVDVQVNGDAPHTNAMLFLRINRDTVWQHDLITLRPNQVNRLYFRLQEQAAWHNPADPKASLQPYDLLNVQEIGLRLFNDSRITATYAVDDPFVLGPYSEDVARQPALAIQKFRSLTPKPAQYQRVEYAFALNRTFRNPYDPSEIQIDVEWDDPAGKTHRHPGFFYQPIAIAKRAGAEQLTWTEQPEFRVRFTPQAAGEYAVRLVARAGKERLVEERNIQVAARKSPGYVQIAKDDPRWFEFQDGSFYYPIGHNLRSPSDRRKMLSDKVWEDLLVAEKEGVFAFDQWFDKMAANGENFSRMWLCPWWAGLEWNTDTPGFHGLGFYNQENAARVDHVIASAEAKGIYINLEPMNHGQLSTRIDEQWTLNPLCEAQPGGFLRYASDFYASEEAQRLHRQRMRYVIARWGYSPAIAFWGLITETEWTEAWDRGNHNDKVPTGKYVPAPYRDRRYQNQSRRWLRDVADYFKETDAHPHLVTGHFSNPVNGNDMWRDGKLEIMHNNAYTLFANIGIRWQTQNFRQANGVADVIWSFGRFYEKVSPRPILIGEWGGTPFGDPIQPLRQELHTGIWTEFMTNCAGVTGWWWWNVLDSHDDYTHFKALAAFAKGEERRGRQLTSERIILLDSNKKPTVPAAYAIPQQGRWGGVLRPDQLDLDATHRWAITLSDEVGLYAYAYTSQINRYRRSTYAEGFDDPQFSLSGPLFLNLPDDLRPGDYRVEYWNTFTGEIFKTTSHALKPGTDRLLALPPHRVDLAVKMKRLGDK